MYKSIHLESFQSTPHRPEVIQKFFESSSWVLKVTHMCSEPVYKRLEVFKGTPNFLDSQVIRNCNRSFESNSHAFHNVSKVFNELAQ